MADRGWYKHSPEHSLASKGISTKEKDTRTRTRLLNKTTENPPTTSKHSKKREEERIMSLFADYNQRSDVNSSIDNDGIYLSSRETQILLRNAIPNGCGTFNNEKIKQLTGAFKNPEFMIRRDEDGGVIILVKGTTQTHPGAIRDWVGATSCTKNEDGVYVYKWSPITVKKAKDNKLTERDELLLEWAEQVKTRQTDLSFPEWVKSGEE
jgi:hypothetical protein